MMNRFYDSISASYKCSTASSSERPTTSTTLAIMRETYDKWERRAPLTPFQVQELLTYDPTLRILIEPSPQRIFSDQEYAQAGASLTSDLRSAEIVLGVKRPHDCSSLLPHKTYVFFSHVIKGQQENMPLLQYCLDNYIQLMDYERMLQPPQQDERDHYVRRPRLVSFSHFAGMAGAIDSLSALGRRLLYTYHTSTPFLECPLSWMHGSLQEAKENVHKVGEQLAVHGIPRNNNNNEPLVMVVTGKGGKVHGGVMEILKLLPHEIVAVEDLPALFATTAAASNTNNNIHHHKVYIVPVALKDIVQRRVGGSGDFDRTEFQQHPDRYRSVFAERVAPYATVIYNGVYWDARFPRLLTKEEMQCLYYRQEQNNNNNNTRLLLLADITCDAKGSIEFLERTTTIEKPFFQYDPLRKREISDAIGEYGVTVLGVDILPTEFPREASQEFGQAVVDIVKEMVDARHRQESSVVGVDPRLLTLRLSDACITTADGRLSSEYRYLDSVMKRALTSFVQFSDKAMVLALEGHLFDSGLINKIVDAVELQGGLLEFEDVAFPPISAHHERKKSRATLKVSAQDEESLFLMEMKLQTLIDATDDKAEATMIRIDRRAARAGSARQHPRRLRWTRRATFSECQRVMSRPCRIVATARMHSFG